MIYMIIYYDWHGREYTVDHAGDGEYRVQEGYASLLRKLLGNDLSRGPSLSPWWSSNVTFDLYYVVSLNQEVEKITWSKGQVEISTKSGKTFRCQRAILTFPAGSHSPFPPPSPSSHHRLCLRSSQEAVYHL